MITEVDALELAQADASLIHKKIEGGLLPDQLAELTIRMFLRRIDSLETPKASTAARQGAIKQMTSATLSELTIMRLMTMLEHAIVKLPPEDVRALILWLNGTPPMVPGIIKHAVNLLGESSGAQSLGTAETMMGNLLQRMQRSDTELFEIRIKTLNSPRRRIISGILLQSRWFFHERDGISARAHVIKARRLALRWLRENSH